MLKSSKTVLALSLSVMALGFSVSDAASAQRSRPEAGQGSGFGNAIPLSNAVRHIVPQQFVVSYGSGVEVGKKVSWTQGGDWKSTLESLASANGLAVQYDGNEIMIRKSVIENRGGSGFLFIPCRNGCAADVPPPSQARPEMPPPVATAPQPSISSAPLPQAASPSQPTEAPRATADNPFPRNGEWKPTAPPVRLGRDAPKPAAQDSVTVQESRIAKKPGERHWSASKGTSLETVVRDWSSRAGWQLIWDSSNSHTVPDTFWYDGEFDVAVRNVVLTLGNERNPIEVMFYPDSKQVVIKDKAA